MHGARFALFGLALLQAGCVTFEKETIVIVFPRDSQQIKVLLVYEGLRVNRPEAAALKTAKEQLARFVTTGQEFCLGDNFMLHFDLSEDKKDNLTSRAQKVLLRQNLAIENGSFFQDKQGKLCGFQTITIRDGNRLSTAVNAMLSAALSQMASQGLAEESKRPRGMDEATLKRIQQACQDKFPWLQHEPGRISFTLPATPAFSSQLKHTLLEAERLTQLRELILAPAENAGKREQQIRTLGMALAREMQMLVENPWSFDQRSDRFTLALGLGNGEPIQVVSRPEENRAYTKTDEELAAHALTLKEPLRGGTTVERLIKDFLRKAQQTE